MDIGVSKVFTKNVKANTRIIVNEGSSRSTKTYSIIQYFIMLGLTNRGLKFTISRAKLTWLKASVMPDFFDILSNQFNLYNANDHNKTDQIYRLNYNEYHFVGLDESQKLHGRKQDYTWINEAIETNQKDFTQLAIRTTKQIILDYNPSTDNHWIYDSVIPRKDCTFIKSTYKDNPFLEPEIINEIERLEPTPENIAQGTADAISWKIYGLGERASQEGLIFGDIGLVDDFPEDCKKIWYGLDFGFTNDPTVLIKIGLKSGGLYFKQLIYKRGLTNLKNTMKPSQPSIQAEFERLEISKHAIIKADSAEPKSIQDLRNIGYQMRGAKKGPDSIIRGIDVIKRYPCFITNDSIDLIKERNNYKWAIDKDGKALNKPVDAFNHGWDAIRYALSDDLDRPKISPSIRSL